MPMASRDLRIFDIARPTAVQGQEPVGPWELMFTRSLATAPGMICQHRLLKEVAAQATGHLRAPGHAGRLSAQGARLMGLPRAADDRRRVERPERQLPLLFLPDQRLLACGQIHPQGEDRRGIPIAPRPSAPVRAHHGHAERHGDGDERGPPPAPCRAVAALKPELAGFARKKAQLMERLLAASDSVLVSFYEEQVRELHERKIGLEDKLAGSSRLLARSRRVIEPPL